MAERLRYRLRSRSVGRGSKTGYCGARPLNASHCRSLRHGEEALHLAGEAVEIGLENRPAAGRKLAHGVAAAHRAGEHDFACLTLRYELISTERSRRLVSRHRSRGLPRSCSFAQI